MLVGELKALLEEVPDDTIINLNIWNGESGFNDVIEGLVFISYNGITITNCLEQYAPSVKVL